MRFSPSGFAKASAEAWRLAKPYYFSEERWAARGLLAVIIVLNLAQVFISVVVNYWYRDFWNELQAYHLPAAIRLIFFYVHTPGSLPMPGFIEIVTVNILIAVYAYYLNQMLQIRWRRWLTRHFIEEWLGDHAYYRLGLEPPAAAGIDNPDQRIADDLRDFTTNSLSLGLSFVSNVVNLFSFLFILYAISGSITLFGVTIDGYMVWVALIYSVIGTVFTHLIGRKLIGLSFFQQKVEADFRFSLIRIRENPEAIAMAGGERDEHGVLRERFRFVLDNWWAIMRRTKALNFFTVGFNQIAIIIPIVAAFPLYFAKKIGIGGIQQIANAFGNVQGSFSWIVTSYTDIATWRATVARLASFQNAVADARAAARAKEVTVTQSGAALSLDHLHLTLPDGRVLVEDATLAVGPGEPVLLTGPSGAGKSTLFRTIAGIWPFARGAVSRPAAPTMFLPQRPYFPLGSIKRAACYPTPETEVADEAVRDALEATGLGMFAGDLQRQEKWEQVLSGGGQQRLALARALIAAPAWLYLDEATSALDPAAEASLLVMLRRRLPRTTIIAISHRDLPVQALPGVKARRLTLTPGAAPRLGETAD